MEVGASVIIVVEGAESPPTVSEIHEGIWVMTHGLVTVEVSLTDAWLMVISSVCQYGGVTPECDADLAEAGLLIKELGYTKTGVTKEEDGLIMMELV